MTISFIYFGDPHIRGTSPRNRTDDYKLALIAKLREIFHLAKIHGVQAIIQPGDTFDRPEVSDSIKLEFADILAESPVPIYTTPGNHDLYGYNLETYRRTSLAILERLVPQFHVIHEPGTPTYFEDAVGTVVQLTFTPYTNKMDREGYGYGHEVTGEWTALGARPFSIHVSHGMLLDHEPPFDRYTLVQDVKTNADLVLTGHDHTGYGIFKRRDGKTFVNLGSLTRLAASQAEVKRTIQAALIRVDKSGHEYYHDVRAIELKSAKPGNEVLDRSGIEAAAERQYAMETFSTLIQSQTGDTVAVDVDAIIEAIAAQKGYNPEVVRIALETIQKQREGVE